MRRLYLNCCSIARNHPFVLVICTLVLVVLGLYFGNFHYGLSDKNDDWGTFGDYFGGILNPILAAFVLYWIVETYKLQKTELQETKRLINDQVKLAALTALLNSNLTRISLLKSERIELLNEIPVNLRHQATDTRSNEDMEPIDVGVEKSLSGEYFPRVQKLREINGEIKSLIDENNELEEQIKVFLRKKQNDFM